MKSEMEGPKNRKRTENLVITRRKRIPKEMFPIEAIDLFEGKSVKKKTIAPRKKMIASTREHPHIHLGAPLGFGKTTLLELLMRHYMRSGKTARRGIRLDRAKDPNALQRMRELTITHGRSGIGFLFVALDNLTLWDMEPLALIVANAAKNIRIFTAGTPLPLSFAPLKLSGVTLELGPGELAFDADEASAFVPLELWEVTGGWPAVCAFASGMNVTVFYKMLQDKRGLIRSWMFENFLKPLSEGGRELLFCGAALEELTPEACDELCGVSFCDAFLEAFHLDGGPLRHTSQGYVLLKLFKEYLHAEINWLPDPDAIWKKAAFFYEKRGKYDEAVNCILKCRDASNLTQYVEGNLLPGLVNFSEREEWTNVRKMVEGMRTHVTSASPRMLILMAQHLFRTGDAGEARIASKVAVEVLHANHDLEGLVQAAVVCARILRDTSSPNESNALLEQIERENPDMSVTLQYHLVAERVANYCHVSFFSEAHDLLETLIAKAEAEGNTDVILWCRRLLTVPNFYMGRYNRALECFDAVSSIPPDQILILEKHEVRIYAARCHQLQGREKVALAMMNTRLESRKRGFYDNLWLVYSFAWDIEYSRQKLMAVRGKKPNFTRAYEFIERASIHAAENRWNDFFLNFTAICRGVTEMYLYPERARQIAEETLQTARKAAPFHRSLALNRMADFLLSYGNAPEVAAYAIDLHRECLAIEKEMQSDVFGVLSRVSLGVLYWKAGLVDTAIRYFTPSLKRIEEEDAVHAFALLPYETLYEAGRMTGVARRFLERMQILYPHPLKKLRACLFGPFSLTLLTEPETGANGFEARLSRRKLQELFALLLFHYREGLEREVIIETLWSEHPPAKGLQLFFVALSQLRKELAKYGVSPSIERVGPKQYRVNLEQIMLDLSDYHAFASSKALAELLASYENEERRDELLEEFRRYRVAPFQKPLLADFDAPWAREAAAATPPLP